MENFRQIWQPIVQYYNRYLFDPYMVDITAYKGGQSAGTDWVSRHFQTHIHHIKQKYFGLQRRFQEVNLTDLLQDNWFRLIILNGIDRTATIRQAHFGLRIKAWKPDSNSFAVTQVTNGGLLRGWFRGSVANTLQFSSVAFPALYICNTFDTGIGKLASFLAFYTLFDALMFPLDKIKTLLYADTRLEYKNLQVFKQLKSLSSSYHGVIPKLLFNIPWAWATYASVNDTSTIEKILSWAAVALLYPLNTFKTLNQISGTTLGSNSVMVQPHLGMYRGFVPFALANFLGHIVFYNLAGKSRQRTYMAGFAEEQMQYNQNYHYKPSQHL